MITREELSSSLREQIDDSKTRIEEAESRLDSVDSQLAQKVNKGDSISVNQIDKNKGKIDQSYLSDELLKQIAGDTPINSTVADNSLTISKLAFDPVLSSSTENLFNKYRCVHGYYVLNTDGKLYKSADFTTSDYIEVTPGDILTKNTYNMGAFYDSDKTYISGIENGDNSFEVPSNAVYFRYCIPTEEVDFAMLVVGYNVPPASTNYIEPIQINDNMIGDLALNKIVNHIDNNYIVPYIIRCWENIIVDGNTVNLLKRQVYQNPKNGKWILVQSDNNMIFTINDGYTLTVNGDFNNITLDSNAFELVPISNTLKSNAYPLISNIAGILTSHIPSYQQCIYHYTFNSQGSTVVDNQELSPLSINDKLSELAPVFYEKYKKQEEDITIVLLGDSISTTNFYTKSREDAMYRPPLMTEYAYPTFIEEQLRWDGQKYYRYDTGIFTEVATSKENLEYDLNNWDWSGNNNRPALTRVLTGDNCSVSFNLPSNAIRCDFIYRTDKLNADNCTLSISAGDNKLEVYDESSSSWVEANRFVYSAKEIDAEKNTELGLLNKSMYQKRLKIRVKGTEVPNTKITITNNGSGRLTYWGIQTSPRNSMIDFILSARGGHNIQRLEKFEEWDVDYYKPDLILWECPILNHNMDVCNSDFSPKNMGNHTTDSFSAPFITKAKKLLSKDYSPELISWIMWFGMGNNAINNKNEWCYGICTNGERVSVPNYISKLDYLLRKNNINNLNLFNFYMDYAKKSCEKNNSNIINDTLSGSGTEGKTLTIDGGHFNTKGAKVTNEIFGSFFIQ